MSTANIATQTDLNNDISNANSATGTPITASFTADVTETATPTTITAASGALILDGVSEVGATGIYDTYALASDGTDPALKVSGAVTIESLFIDGNITDTGTITFTAAGNSANGMAAVNGAITGTGGAVTVDSGAATDILILNGANTYTGETTITQGYVVLGPNGSIAGSDEVFVDSTGTLDISEAAATVALTNLAGTGAVVLGSNTLAVTETADTFTGAISGDGSLAIYGTDGGGLVLTSTDTYHGATKLYGDATISSAAASFSPDSSNFSLKASGATLTVDDSDNGNAGVVIIGSLSGVSGSTVDVTGGSLVIDQGSAATFSGAIETMAAGNTVTVEGTATLTLAGANTYTGATTVGDGTHASSLDVTGSLGDTAITVKTKATLTVAGSIAGTVDDLGTVDVSGSSGAGAITVGNGTSLGGTLAVIAGGVIVDGSVELDGFSAAHVALLDISNATGPVGVSDLTSAGTTADDSVYLGTQTLVLYGTETGSNSFDGVISGTGAVQFGSSTTSSSQSSPAGSAGSDYEIGALQTYQGATKIYGTLELSAATVDGQTTISDSSNVSLKVADATLELVDGNSQTIGSLSGVANTVIELSADGATTLTIDQTTAATFSGSIEETSGDHSFAVTLEGDAILTLAGVNTYGGKTTISSGSSLALSGSGSIASSNEVLDEGTLTVSGVTGGAVTLNDLTDTTTLKGALVLGSTTATIDGGTFYGVISGNGGVTVSGALTLDGANIYTGTTTIDDGATLTVGGSLASPSIVDNGGTLLFDPIVGSPTAYRGVLSGTGSLEIQTGKTLLTGVDTFTGTTTVSGTGYLVLSGSGSLADSAIILDNTATLKLDTTSSAVTLTSLADDTLGTASLLLGTTALTLAGDSSFTGTITGSGSITLGSATETTAPTTLTLSGSNEYTGVTKVFGDLTLGSDLTGAVSLKGFTVGTTAMESELILGADVTIGSLSGVAGTTVTASAADALTIDQTTAATFSGTFGTSSQSLGLVTVEGSAALTLATADALEYTGGLDVTGTLTLGATQTVTALEGSGTINLGSNSLVDVNTGASELFSGTITGTGIFTVEGSVDAGPETSGVFGAGSSSLLTLSHASSSFSGILFIETGTVELAASGAVGTATISFNDSNSGSGALQIDNAALTGSGTTSESFTNHITGFAEYDIIDLPGLAYGGTVATTLSGNSLTVIENGVSVTLSSISGVSTYYAYEDGHGGTYITGDATAYDSGHYHP